MRNTKPHPASPRIALITGATGAIGKAIAAGIAATPGFAVVLLCRDPARGEAAVVEIAAQTGNPQVSYEQVDLASKASIDALAERWQSPVHVLVNCAAATARRRTETAEGIELQFATNVLGYFRLSRSLRAYLAEAAPARVVNVASYWAGGLDLTDLEFKRRRYDNDPAYRQSKQANRMLTVAFARQWSAEGISVNACHPGDVRSALSCDLGFGGHESPELGAATPVWLATTPVGVEATGQYFEHQRQTTCRFGADLRAVDALYQACEGYD
jgi:NAD(P)-dependent dehydrogenase (short-subunit alcohol dehydrogenase family)